MTENFETDTSIEPSVKFRSKANWAPNTFKGAVAIVVIGAFATAAINKVLDISSATPDEAEQAVTLVAPKKNWTEPPTLNFARSYPITYCKFYEKNMLGGRNSISGQLQESLNVKLKFDNANGEFVHLSDEFGAYSQVATKTNSESSIPLTSLGRLVELRKLNTNEISGFAENEKILAFKLDKDTGKYSYQQFGELDQTIKSQAGYRVTLSFSVHIHRSEEKVETTYVHVDVYDQRHDPSEIIPNLGHQ